MYGVGYSIWQFRPSLGGLETPRTGGGMTALHLHLTYSYSSQRDSFKMSIRSFPS